MRNDFQITMISRVAAALILVAAVHPPCAAQTTQGLIAGKVFDAETTAPIVDTVIEYSRGELGSVAETGSVRTNAAGFFAFPFLPPGTYRIRSCAGSCQSLRQDTPEPGAYQPQEIYGIPLFVAARLEVNFALRKLTDVWKAGIQSGLYENSTTAIIHYYASDVAQLRSAYLQLVPYRTSSLGATVSYVADPLSVQNLPLAGRDIYTALVLQPGVTAAAATARGLGLSVNGQRPTASNYLLDGLENNNALVTGPLTSLAPEMIQEYRISTSSWSAEYGGTAGFLANAVTRAGGGAWHGNAHIYRKNDALNANTFQNNAHELPRSPFKETQYGFQSGGPLRKRSLFVSAGVEVFRSRSYQQAETIGVPSPLLVNKFLRTDPAWTLLTNFPTPATDPGNGTESSVTVRPTVSFDRFVALARTDYVSGARRLMLRVAVNRFERPDFIWYPYKDFVSGLTQPLTGLALAYSHAVQSSLTHEFHAGWSRNTTRWDRSHPEIPTLAVGQSEIRGQPPPLLPGSPVFYGLRDTNRNLQVNDTWAWVRGAHIVKTGGGLLVRGLDSLMTTGQGGEVIFNNTGFFVIGRPNAYTTAVDRLSPRLQSPGYGRTYRNTQYFLFGEDTWRVGSHLVFNAGIRYESFGAPVNTGGLKDAMVQLGSGSSFAERLGASSLAVPSSGDQNLWAAQHNLAPRFGVTWTGGSSTPVIRGGYGIFFDRPFDNLWQNVRNNNLVVPPSISCTKPDGTYLCTPAGIGDPLGYLAPASKILSALQGSSIAKTFPSLTLMDPRLRSGYVQSYFLGLQERIADSLDLELNALGAQGRRLLTSDVVNRALSTPRGPYNPDLPEISWRSTQGSSHYSALAAVLHYRTRHASLQASYTWSHSIDNQSDPLAGDFFDLSFVKVNSSEAPPAKAAFARQFDSSADRATSDFDQRHNLVFYSWWDVPVRSREGIWGALARDWHFAQMAAFRTGFPYTVSAASTEAILNQRADLIHPGQIAAPAGTRAGPGAVALLNPAAFAEPPRGVLGNSGRNAFRGPGLWNIDLSVSRTFPVRPLGESGHVVLRADFFNALNHANLNNPNSRLESDAFGQASYGRLDNTGFPTLVPLHETPRQIQMIVRLEF